MTKNILIDYHHTGLADSYLYTLEKRLGYKIWRPIGEEWFTKGFWKINRQRDTIQQYLGNYGYQPLDGTAPLNNINYSKDNIYYSTSPDSGLVHRAITYKKFMEMKWFAVISSIPQHIEPYTKLAEMKKCFHIFQEGNNFHLPDSSYKNLLSSTMPRKTTCHSIFYHQEFDTDVFSYEKPQKRKEIHTYVNVFKDFPDYQFFLDLEKEMPDYVFKIHGSQSRDGCISGTQNLANSMKKARWIFHAKAGGDGYGFTVHQAFAVGRPLIVNKRYYEGHLAGTLMDDQSSIIMDGLNPKQLATIIRNREQNNEQMSKESHKRFTDAIDWEKEAKLLDKFLKELV